MLARENRTQQWIARVHRDDKQRLRAEHIRAFKERRLELINEFRVVRPGGEVRWIEGRSLVVYDHAGRAERMTGVYIDVTERKQTEALLSESKALNGCNGSGPGDGLRMGCCQRSVTTQR